ncbi:MAG: hypothetical protein WCO44_03500 [Bacteroidota bacterium]
MATFSLGLAVADGRVAVYWANDPDPKTNIISVIMKYFIWNIYY